MGSSIASPTWAAIAAVFAALYVTFDGARYFVHRLGAVRLKRWSAEPGMRGGAWFEYDQDKFSLISGALLQMALVGGVGATVAAFKGGYTPKGVLVSVIVWGAAVVGWKFVLGLIPESLGEPALRGLIAVSHIVYYVFWPVLFPLVWTLSRVERRRESAVEEEEVSEEEIQAFIDVGEEEGILEEGEGRLVQSIVDFGDRIVREVMTPRVEIQAFDITGRVEALAALCSDTKYSRIPVYERDIDHIVGLVHVKDLFDVVLRGMQREVKDLMRPPYFVSETKRVAELLREFQIEHLQIGIVVDEFGGTAGLVSIEDLLEEIVGEIADEHEDDEESMIEVEPGTYLVNGSTRVQTVEEVFSVTFEDEGYETVAGLIFTATGRVPKMREIISKNGLQFEVERADRRKIYRVRVSREPQRVEEVMSERS